MSNVHIFESETSRSLNPTQPQGATTNACPKETFCQAKVVDIFQRISKELAGSVPLKVINDGEVWALVKDVCLRHGVCRACSGSTEFREYERQYLVKAGLPGLGFRRV